LRRLRPDAGHPIVALRSIAPISGRPQIAIAGAFRLRIFRQRRRGLSCLEHRLAVGRLLIAGVVIVIVVVLVLRGRRLLIGLLRRLAGGLLLIGTGRLGPVRGGKVGRSCWILRLIGLRRLILVLGSIVLTTLLASRESERQRDGCGCQNDKRRYFARHIPS